MNDCCYYQIYLEGKLREKLPDDDLTEEVLAGLIDCVTCGRPLKPSGIIKLEKCIES